VVTGAVAAAARAARGRALDFARHRRTLDALRS
jgi:hypothetical protein